jgi:hypothetical protein
MAKKNEAHVPNCPFRCPPVVCARQEGKKSPKQAAARRGNGNGWMFGRDMRGGYRPSGAREVMAAGKPTKAVAYKVG